MWRRGGSRDAGDQLTSAAGQAGSAWLGAAVTCLFDRSLASLNSGHTDSRAARAPVTPAATASASATWPALGRLAPAAGQQKDPLGWLPDGRLDRTGSGAGAESRQWALTLEQRLHSLGLPISHRWRDGGGNRAQPKAQGCHKQGHLGAHCKDAAAVNCRQHCAAAAATSAGGCRRIAAASACCHRLLLLPLLLRLFGGWRRLGWSCLAKALAALLLLLLLLGARLPLLCRCRHRPRSPLLRLRRLQASGRSVQSLSCDLWTAHSPLSLSGGTLRHAPVQPHSSEQWLQAAGPRRTAHARQRTSRTPYRCTIDAAGRDDGMAGRAVLAAPAAAGRGSCLVL